VLPAYPHGSIRIGCAASAGAGADSATVRERAARLLEWFAETVERERLEVETAPSGAEPSELLLVLAGYAESSTPRAPAP
jgi:hypothetical protein